MILFKKTAFCFFFLLVFSSFIGKTQNSAKPLASFSFNSGRDYDDVNKLQARLIGVGRVADRFGNANNAVYTYGNEYSYINLGPYKELKSPVGSVSLWVKIERGVWIGKGEAANPILIAKGRAQDDFYEAYGVYYIMGSHKFSINSARDSLKQAVVMSKNPIPFYEWRHLVITYDNNFYALYVDGELQRKVIKGFETQFLEKDSVLMGATGNKKNVRFTDGALDDVAFYNKVLTEQEILELYHAPNPNRFGVIIQWIIIGFAILLAIWMLYFFIRYRVELTLKKKQERFELQNIVLETELRVNRALMNPHFVFNSLNALQSFILKNENKLANNYLVKFSKLMRMILESNTSNLITLELEVRLLESYLEIENLRFKGDVHYVIRVEESLIPSNIKIPIMMIQPFVENAIWHGLLKSNKEKELHISFKGVQGKYVSCTVQDNGVGRPLATEIELEKKSLAIGFIKQRISLLNRIHDLKCTLSIEDMPNKGGTKVEILLPILKK